MFKVLDPEARRRRVWSAGTVTVSLAAHVLVLAGAAYASLHASPPPPPREVVTDLGPLPPAPPPIKDPPQEQPREQPRQPSTPGTFIEVHTPVTVPDKIPAVDPTLAPLPRQDDGADGKGGDHIGPPNGQPGTGSAEVPDDGLPEGVVDMSDLAEIPSLQNAIEVQRVLQRSYPPLLREAGVMGEARLQFIINTDGRVEATSVQVVGATNQQFGDAAKRAVEHFRFKPASMMGEPVRVLITIPIRFTLQPH
jgi:protein TonB